MRKKTKTKKTTKGVVKKPKKKPVKKTTRAKVVKKTKKPKVVRKKRVKRIKAKKLPNFDVVLKKREKLASAIKESLAQEKQDIKPKTRAKKTSGLGKRAIENVDKTLGDLNLADEVESVVYNEPASDRNVSVKIVNQPMVSPHLVDLKKIEAEKEEMRRASQRRIVNLAVNFRLSDKEYFYGNLKELSIVSLFRLIYGGGKKCVIYTGRLLAKTASFWPQVQAAFKKKKVVRAQVQPAKSVIKEPKEEITYLFGRLAMPVGWQKSLIAFVIVCLLLALPIQAFTYYSEMKQKKAEITGFSAEALVHLRSGVQAASTLSFDTAEEEFAKANKGFVEASRELAEVNSIVLQLLKLVPGQGRTVQSGEVFVRIGEKVSLLGQLFSQSAEALNYDQLENVSLIDSLNVIKVNTQKIVEVIEALEKDIAKADLTLLPPEYQEQFVLVGDKMPQIKLFAQRLNNLAAMLHGIMAPDDAKRYLLVFQNNREMRGSGGFLGSYGLLDVYKGEIQKFEVPAGGSYDVSGQILDDIVGPEPLQYINPRWEFHDSNWWPDWPTSARKIIWFFERGALTKVDGVIAVTPTVIEQLLPIYGPIDLTEDYEVAISQENLVDIIQQEIEYRRRADSNEPKQILTDLSAVLLEKLFKSKGEDLWPALSVLNKAVLEKHILFYSPEQELERLALENGIAGEIKQTSGDYLAVINANIGGGKTDHIINEDVWHEVEIADDGSIIDNLTIKRKHNGDIDSFFESHGNVNYMRIYVPLGSQLLEAGGFTPPTADKFLAPSPEAIVDSDYKRIEGEYIVEPYTKTRIYEQFGKTVFANWTKTEVGQETEVRLKYKLPFKVNSPKEKGWANWIKDKINWPKEPITYSLLTQKQSGALAKNYYLNIKYPNQVELVQEYQTSLCPTTDNTITCAIELGQDKIFALIFKKIKNK